MEKVEKYTSIAQRVASSYLRSLADSEATEPGQRDLRGFFLAFYTALYDHPEQFGLPLIEDDSFVEGEANGTAHKAELNKKRKKPQDLILAGLDFLMTAGRCGQLDGQALALDEESAVRVKKVRGLRAFLEGLKAAGMMLVEEGGSLRLGNPTYPAMMPALQTLARDCAVVPDARLGAFHFARCDFRASKPGYLPDPLDLYRTFPAADYERAAALHEYFTGKKYQAIVEIAGVNCWVVKYQGSRKVKASPLFQIEYQERHRDPVILYLKPASTNRIASLITSQSQALQEDFFRRAFYCRGDECGWCKNNKNLGPTTMTHNSQEVVLCWYSNPTMIADENMIPLVEEYVEMHEALVK